MAKQQKAPVTVTLLSDTASWGQYKRRWAVSGSGKEPYTENPVKSFFFALLILAFCAAPAFAAAIFPAGVKTVAECEFATKPLAQIVAPLAYPADWKIVVACTDGEWQSITRHFDATASESAFTMRDNKVTVINSRIFREKVYSGPEHTLRHELGHIVCNTKSEDAADHFADTGVCGKGGFDHNEKSHQVRKHHQCD